MTHMLSRSIDFWAVRLVKLQDLGPRRVALGPAAWCRRRRAQPFALPVESSEAFWAVTALRNTLQASSQQRAETGGPNSKSSDGYSWRGELHANISIAVQPTKEEAGLLCEVRGWR
jgi:hypothetical protein